MTDQITELVVGFFLPLLIRFAARPGQSDAVKNGITLLFCVIAGVATTYATTGRIDLSADLAGSVMTVTISAMTAYRNLWKPAMDKTAGGAQT